MVGAGEYLPRAKLGQDGFHIGDGAAHPFELRVVEALAPESVAHSVIGDDASVVPLGALVQLDGVIRDGGGFELFRDTLFHVAGGLADLKQPVVRVGSDGVGVDARARLRFGREDFVNSGFIHRPPPSGGSWTR